MKTQTHTMPAVWACAIINLDYSGLTQAEKRELNNHLVNEGLSFVDCLTCGESYIGRFKGQLCQVADYVYPA